MTLVRRYDCPARRSSRAAPCRGAFHRLTAHAAHPGYEKGLLPPVLDCFRARHFAQSVRLLRLLRFA